jgi:hypothetical protein
MGNPTTLRSDLDTAKEQLRIPELWQICGLPGKPASSCSSPFRADRSPSFSIYDEGRRWRDHALGEGGDAVDFLAKAKGIHPAQAYVFFLEMVGKGLPMPSPAKQGPVKRGVAPLDLKGLEPCRDKDLERIAKLRSIPLEGLRIAVSRKVLFAHENLYQGRCWLVTDDARRSAISRRLDGKRFHFREPRDGKKEGPKSRCWPGSQANWPIGIMQADGFPAIVLCEGGPDFLAAFYLAWAGGVEQWVAPVCMTGAACQIHEDALQMFRGRRVRIFGHADQPGQAATIKWTEQLRSVQAEVDGFSFSGLVQADGQCVKDLNDLLLADHQKSGCKIEVTAGAFDFALERKR